MVDIFSHLIFLIFFRKQFQFQFLYKAQLKTTAADQYAGQNE